MYYGNSELNPKLFVNFDSQLKSIAILNVSNDSKQFYCVKKISVIIFMTLKYSMKRHSLTIFDENFDIINSNTTATTKRIDYTQFLLLLKNIFIAFFFEFDTFTFLSLHLNYDTANTC